MKIPVTKICENASSPHHTEKIARRLDEFPELVQALRNGDHVSARVLFAQLFDGESDQIEARMKPTLHRNR